VGGLYVKTNVADAANTEASVKAVVEARRAQGGGELRRHRPRRPHHLQVRPARPRHVLPGDQVNLIGTFNVIRLASWAMSQADPLETASAA
jgi:hypothetical protein